MNVNIFTDVPSELKTIEVDVDKKIFNVNGVPFGKRCTGFYISAETVEGFKIHMEIDTTVCLASYDINGKKITDYTYERYSR